MAQKAIRFLRPWQGRQRGAINDTLAPGIMQTLVQNNIAAWEEPAADEPKRRKRRTEKEQDTAEA
jgi:hypothetical protein